MIDRDFNGFYEGLLPDIRYSNRVEKMMTDMLTFGNVVVNKFCTSNTDKIGAYRMLSNDKVNSENLAKGVFQSCKKNQGAKHLLCLQDTTELLLDSHIGRIGKENIGSVSNKKAGLFCHPTLVVDPENQTPIGVSYIHLWNRPWERKSKEERDYKGQPVEEKESYRWIESSLETKKLLADTPLLTMIGDRESDIYEEFDIIPDKKTHLLVRASVNRNLFESDVKLFESLASAKEQGRYSLEIKGNKKRKNRIAQMSVRYRKVKLQKPLRTSKKYAPYIEMWAIETRELSESTPAGEDPILWRLLTTHPIENFEDACLYAQWYSLRWLIEELFRVLKTKGLQIESNQLGSEQAIKKLLTLSIQVALVVMTLKLSITRKSEEKASLFFTEKQIKFISILLGKVEGKTAKQKNPYPKDTLAWASWTIARLSGWSGYKSHGPPGYITLKSGLDIFHNRYDGYLLAMDLFNSEEVYKE